MLEGESLQPGRSVECKFLQLRGVRQNQKSYLLPEFHRLCLIWLEQYRCRSCLTRTLWSGALVLIDRPARIEKHSGSMACGGCSTPCPHAQSLDGFFTRPAPAFMATDTVRMWTKTQNRIPHLKAASSAWRQNICCGTIRYVRQHAFRS